jgi:hypothetical protein
VGVGLVWAWSIVFRTKHGLRSHSRGAG